MTAVTRISQNRVDDIVAACQAEDDRYEAANRAAGGYDWTIAQNVWEHVLYPLPEYDPDATERYTLQQSEDAVLSDGTLVTRDYTGRWVANRPGEWTPEERDQ